MKARLVTLFALAAFVSWWAPSNPAWSEVADERADTLRGGITIYAYTCALDWDYVQLYSWCSYTPETCMQIPTHDRPGILTEVHRFTDCGFYSFCGKQPADHFACWH